MVQNENPKDSFRETELVTREIHDSKEAERLIGEGEKESNVETQSPSDPLHKLEKNQKAEGAVDPSPEPTSQESWDAIIKTIDSRNDDLVKGHKKGKSTTIKEPTLQESWDAIIKTIDNRDDDLVKGHKEDIDTLLVYAGLFSVVVTAFTIESFKWLQEDPADSTVVLLTQIAQQLSGQPSPVMSPPKPLAPSSSLFRMNTCWTTSLILALVDALFALLCKQWLREHQRPMNTRTPGQALALRWLRTQSFKQWHVSTILASLPILLEFALFFFFAGLLELSWVTGRISFAIALSVVGLAVLFYIVTTLLPGIGVIRQVLQIHPSVILGTIHPYNANVIDHLPSLHSICPYKSPQSWLIFRLFSATYRIPGCKRFLHSCMVRLWKDGPKFSVEDFNDNINKNILLLENWSSHDLNVIQRLSELPDHPDIYELKGYQWLVRETRDMPSTRPHLKNVLRQLPPHLVMPSVFDRWVLPEWGSWRETDVDVALQVGQPSQVSFGDQTSAHDLALLSRILFFQHLLVIYDDYWAEVSWDGLELATATRNLCEHILSNPKNRHFIEPLFSCIVKLFDPRARRWGGHVLEVFTEKWTSLDSSSQTWLVERLSKSILRVHQRSSAHKIRSSLLASKKARNFFTVVHNGLLENKDILNGLHQHHIIRWLDVLSHIRHLNGLPAHYFKPLPGYLPIPVNEFEELLNDPSSPEIVLEPLLDSYKECWDLAKEHQRRAFVKALSDHINRVLSGVPDDSLDPTSESEGSGGSSQSIPPSVSSVFVGSQQGLEFLSFLDKKLSRNAGSIGLIRKGDVFDAWEEALERVRVFRRLPSDYFKSTSMILTSDLNRRFVGDRVDGVVNVTGFRGGEAFCTEEQSTSTSNGIEGLPVAELDADGRLRVAGQADSKSDVELDLLESGGQMDYTARSGLPESNELGFRSFLGGSTCTLRGRVEDVGADNNV